MASMAAATEPSLSPVPMLTDSLVPASIFAPDRGCGDDAGVDCFEDGEIFNGEVGDHGIDFSSKVTLGLWAAGNHTSD